MTTRFKHMYNAQLVNAVHEVAEVTEPEAFEAWFEELEARLQGVDTSQFEDDEEDIED